MNILNFGRIYYIKFDWYQFGLTEKQHPLINYKQDLWYPAAIKSSLNYSEQSSSKIFKISITNSDTLDKNIPYKVQAQLRSISMKYIDITTLEYYLELSHPKTEDFAI